MARSTEQAVTEILEAYGSRRGEWVTLAEIADRTGLTKQELGPALEMLLEDFRNFRAEPEVHGHRITDRDRAVAPVIGGEPRHKISFQVDPGRFPTAEETKRAIEEADRRAATPASTPLAAPAAKAEPPAKTAARSADKPTMTAGRSSSQQRRGAMPQMPPNLDFDSEGNAYKIAEQLQLACQHTAKYCESLANMTWPRLEAGLRDEGLDGGSRWSQLLHGGDARRTARLIVQPLYVVQTDLENAARSAVVFGNRSRVMYFDAIRAARQAKSKSGKSIPVD